MNELDILLNKNAAEIMLSLVITRRHHPHLLVPRLAAAFKNPAFVAKYGKMAWGESWREPLKRIGLKVKTLATIPFGETKKSAAVTILWKKK